MSSHRRTLMDRLRHVVEDDIFGEWVGWGWRIISPGKDHSTSEEAVKWKGQWLPSDPISDSSGQTPAEFIFACREAVELLEDHDHDPLMVTPVEKLRSNGIDPEGRLVGVEWPTPPDAGCPQECHIAEALLDQVASVAREFEFGVPGRESFERDVVCRMLAHAFTAGQRAGELGLPDITKKSARVGRPNVNQGNRAREEKRHWKEIATAEARGIWEKHPILKKLTVTERVREILEREHGVKRGERVVRAAIGDPPYRQCAEPGCCNLMERKKTAVHVSGAPTTAPTDSPTNPRPCAASCKSGKHPLCHFYV